VGKTLNGICIGILLSICAFIIFDRLDKQHDSKTISQLKAQADSLSRLSKIKEIEYRDRIVTNNQIVTKWNLSRDTLVDIDTLYLQAQNDINYLDTSLKKCDTALATCLRLSKVQNDIITIPCPKVSRFGIYGGAGVGINPKGEMQPTLNISFGFKIK
jgi:hypothetical protein